MTENTAQVTPGPVNFRATLAHRDFRLVWSGQAISSVGTFMFPFVIAVLILRRGGGATGLGLVLAVQTITIVLGTLATAALGDRFRRTRIMITADVLRCLAVTALAVTPAKTPVDLFAIPVAVMGFGEGLFQPSFSASIPRLLPEHLLQPGNGLNAASLYLSTVFGPALAGVVVGAWGTGSALAIDAATFVVSIGTLLAIRESAVSVRQAAPGSDGRGWLRQTADDLRGGIRAVRARPWIGFMIAMSTGIMTFGTAPALVLLPVVATTRLGGPHTYAITLVVMGAGAVLGSLVGGRIQTKRPGVVAMCGAATDALALIGLAFFPALGVYICWGIAGFGVTVCQILWLTALQRDVPEDVMTRVMALDWLGSQALMPIGYALTGPIARVVGTRTLLLSGVALICVFTPLPLLARGGTTFSTPKCVPEPDRVG
jgi:predicted MFS family arabinose efflux permease